MSQELYTFACPSCAVKLSVPKALAGVRGPCPQCHAEITAPPPEPEPAPPVFAPAPEIPAPQAPPPRPEMTAGPAALSPLPELPDLPEVPKPPFPPAMEEVTDDIWRRPPSPAVSPQDSSAGEETAAPHRALAPAPRRGMSKSALVGSLLVLLALGAIASLNFLPQGTLQKWVDQVKERVMAKIEGAAPDEAETPLLSPTVVTPEEMAVTSFDFPTQEPPATPAEESSPPAAETTQETAPAEVVPAAPAPTIKPAEEPAPEIAKAEPAAPATSVAATSPATAGPPSLLPDISAPAPASAPSPASTPSEAAAESLAAPRQALTDFLRAKTWRDRLPHSLGGDSLRTEMQQYYKTAKDSASTPTSLEYISHSTVPGTDFTVHAFYATFSDLPQGFPISVEETAQGWKVDWRAFVEFREGRLKKFFDKYQSAPASFRVVLRRTHFFDKDVPNLDNKYCFHVSAPVSGQEGYVFVDKDDSIVAPKIAEKLDWKGVHYDMVKLKWVKGRNNHNYVELRDITDGWREVPAPADRSR